jgi:MOSC domain-containing protein YiiM
MDTGRVVSINVSAGGVPKQRVPEAFIGADGVSGDAHAFRFHGGPDRAVVVYSAEVIEALQAEGHPIEIGSTGENLTVAGIDWTRIAPETEIHIGAVVLRVTRFTAPCVTIRACFLDGDITRIGQKQHPGWSRVCAAVVAEGAVHIGDAVVVRETVPA